MAIAVAPGTVSSTGPSCQAARGTESDTFSEANMPFECKSFAVRVMVAVTRRIEVRVTITFGVGFTGSGARAARGCKCLTG